MLEFSLPALGKFLEQAGLHALDPLYLHLLHHFGLDNP